MCSKVFYKFCWNIPELLLREVHLSPFTYLKFMVVLCKIVIIFLGRNTANSRFLDATNKENNKVMWHRCWGPSIKRGTHLGFNAIRVLKKNVLTFCLHKVLIKCRVSVRKSSIWFYRLFNTVDEILWKKVFTSRFFLNKYFLFILT